MATELTAFYPLVESELPRCPQPLILQTIRIVINDFCERTQLWQVDLDPINIIKDIDTYDLDGEPACADIVRPISVKWNNIELAPLVDYEMPSRTELKLKQKPTKDEEKALLVRVCLRLEMTADEICNQLFDDWHRGLAAGIKSRLMLMSGKPWSNPELALYYKREYDETVGDAIMDVHQGGTNKTLVLTPTYQWV